MTLLGILENLFPLFMIVAVVVSIGLGYLLHGESLRLAVRRYRLARAEVRRLTAERAELAAQLGEAERVIARLSQGSDALLAVVRGQGRHPGGGQ